MDFSSISYLFIVCGSVFAQVAALQWVAEGVAGVQQVSKARGLKMKDVELNWEKGNENHEIKNTSRKKDSLFIPTTYAVRQDPSYIKHRQTLTAVQRYQ